MRKHRNGPFLFLRLRLWSALHCRLDRPSAFNVRLRPDAPVRTANSHPSFRLAKRALIKPAKQCVLADADEFCGLRRAVAAHFGYSILTTRHCQMLFPLRINSHASDCTRRDVENHKIWIPSARKWGKCQRRLLSRANYPSSKKSFHAIGAQTYRRSPILIRVVPGPRQVGVQVPAGIWIPP